MRESLAAWGADEAQLRQALADVPTFALWPENEAPLALLVRMQTQVRVAGANGVVIGIDYQSLPWVMRQVGILPEEESNVFRRLQCAESEMVAVLAERRVG